MGRVYRALSTGCGSRSDVNYERRPAMENGSEPATKKDFQAVRDDVVEELRDMETHLIAAFKSFN
jgi:16S rRNA C1402 N4-methylase RsmH